LQLRSNTVCALLLVAALVPACLTSEKAAANLSNVYQRSDDGKKITYRTEVPSQSGFRIVVCAFFSLFGASHGPPTTSVGDPMVFCLENIDALAERKYATLDEALPSAALLCEIGLDDPLPIVRARALEALGQLLKPFPQGYVYGGSATPYDAEASASNFATMVEVGSELRADREVSEEDRTRDQRAALALGALRPTGASLARRLLSFLQSESTWRPDSTWQRIYHEAEKDQLPHAAYLIAQQALGESLPQLRTAGAQVMLIIDAKASLAKVISTQFDKKPGKFELDQLGCVHTLCTLEDIDIPLAAFTPDLAHMLFNQTESADGAVSYHARRLFQTWLNVPENARPEDLTMALEAYLESRRGLEATTPGGP
jgi:hypothetical protein